MEATTDYRHFRSETDDEGITWLTFDKAETGTNVFNAQGVIVTISTAT